MRDIWYENKSLWGYNLNEIYDYHIVTDSSMEKGQHIIFNDVNYSGVYKRVNDKIQIVKDIYISRKI